MMRAKELPAGMQIPFGKMAGRVISRRQDGNRVVIRVQKTVDGIVREYRTYPNHMVATS